MSGVAVPAIEARRVSLFEVALSVRATVFGIIAALLGFEIWAAASGYGLRVTSDTPSFLSIVRQMAAHPGESVSPFLATGDVSSSHATPYMQLLGSVWRLFGGQPESASPLGIYLFLAGAGLAVTVVLMHAVLIWARTQAGPLAAWLTLPILLTLFGPAQVIWAGDLTFHGFLYAAYFPQNLALAFLCYTLAALESEQRRRGFVLATLAATATFLVHPFTGVLLAVLVSCRGCVLALRRSRRWKAGSFALLLGFAVGTLWPPYSLSTALAETGMRGPVFIVLCAGFPLLVRAFEQPQRALALLTRAHDRIGAERWVEKRTTVGLVFLGFAGTAALAAWEIVLLRSGASDPLVHSNRLALYWVEDRWRWPLMFAAGAVGIVGLMRLASHRRPVPGVWFAACFGIGVLGILGFSVPVWWRFLLFCQPPLALGVAVVLTRLRHRVARNALLATLVGASSFKFMTLVALPASITYFGSPVQTVYTAFAGVLTEPGAVASDPFTAYYVPGVTGHPVLSVTKAHVNSDRELRTSANGYALIHEYYMGPNWWQAARRMWRQGVRYVIVAKGTSLAAPTLQEFSTGPTPLIRTAQDRRLLGAYYYRNNKLGRVVYDSSEFVVYRLLASKLWPAGRGHTT